MERVNVEFLFGNLLDLTWQHVVMWCIGGLLIYLAIAKDMEPTLLLPIGFGTLLVNIPNVDLIQEGGALVSLFNAGIANELFPLILFIGIGAMIDFGPLLSNPKLMIFGAAGISAFPMSGRIVHKMGLKEDPQNFLLMHSIGVNVSGQIASVIAGGLILTFFG